MGSLTILHWITLGALIYLLVKLIRFGLRGSSAPADTESEQIAMIRGPRRFAFDVVGESHYQRAFAELFGDKTEDGINEEVVAELIPEPENKHDSNAVRVAINGLTVGYLPRKIAKEFREEFNKQHHRSLHVAARVKGGWDRGDGDTGQYGVSLDLPQA